MIANDVDKNGNMWRIPSWFPKLEPKIIENLKNYHSELLFFNNKVNLISSRTEKSADLVHVADGILGAQAVFSRTESKTIFDLGSGNGVPGLIMAILDPKRKLVLVESDLRKAEFLKHCISKIGAMNCTVECRRVEDLAANSIHCAVSRGFASLSKALLISRKVAAFGCEYYHFKGPSWSSEMAGIPSQILGDWEPVHTCDYSLPLGESTMSIVLTKKVSH